jgi:hypothetical protein
VLTHIHWHTHIVLILTHVLAHMHVQERGEKLSLMADKANKLQNAAQEYAPPPHVALLRCGKLLQCVHSQAASPCFKTTLSGAFIEAFFGRTASCVMWVFSLYKMSALVTLKEDRNVALVCSFACS